MTWVTAGSGTALYRCAWRFPPTPFGRLARERGALSGPAPASAGRSLYVGRLTTRGPTPRTCGARTRQVRGSHRGDAFQRSRTAPGQRQYRQASRLASKLSASCVDRTPHRHEARAVAPLEYLLLEQLERVRPHFSDLPNPFAAAPRSGLGWPLVVGRGGPYDERRGGQGSPRACDRHSRFRTSRPQSRGYRALYGPRLAGVALAHHRRLYLAVDDTY